MYQHICNILNLHKNRVPKLEKKLNKLCIQKKLLIVLYSVVQTVIPIDRILYKVIDVRDSRSLKFEWGNQTDSIAMLHVSYNMTEHSVD